MRGAFHRERSGSVATMAGLMFFLVATATGGAIDLNNATNHRAELQDVLDAAALAGAADQHATTDEERMAAARRFFMESSFCQRITCAEPNTQMIDGAVVIAASADVDTKLVRITGWDTIEIGAEARAIPPSATPVEVMMMLDYSGSMNSSNKYQDMATAATAFLDRANNRPGDYMKVGIVPFSKYVLTPMEGQYLYDVNTASTLTGLNVVGCVLNREHPYSVSAATPSTSIEGALWPVFSYVTGANPAAGGYSDDYEPGDPQEMTVNVNGSSYTIRYIDLNPSSAPASPTYTVTTSGGGDDDDDDGGGGGTETGRLDGHGKFSATFVGAATMQIDFVDTLPWNPDTSTYGGYAGSSGWSTGADGGLPPTFDSHQLSEDLDSDCSRYADNYLWARPLSTDFAGMRDAIGRMEPIGLTNISLSLDLGWHMLTPNAPFSESLGGTADDADGAHRVAILLTDGVQTVSAHGSSGSVSVTSANENIAQICTAMKAEGIEVFTIAFGVADSYTRTLLRDCASGDPYFHSPDHGGELMGIFDGIFDMIVPDRVRLSG